MFKNKRRKIFFGSLLAVAGVSLAVANSIIKPLVPAQTTPKLVATLASDSPSGAFVPGTGTAVMKFNLAATGADVKIKTIKFQRKGSCVRGSNKIKLVDSDGLITYGELPASQWQTGRGSVEFYKFISSLNVSKDSVKNITLIDDTTGCTGQVLYSIPAQGVKATTVIQQLLGLKPSAKEVTTGNVKGNVLNFLTYAQPAQTRLTAILAVNSPSGVGVPGYSEVMRFTLAVDGDKDVEVKSLSFKPRTTCQNFLNPRVVLYDAADMATPMIMELSWENRGGFINGFNLPYVNEVIAGNYGKTFVVKFDTTGCSAVRDEAFRLDLTGGSWQAQPGGALSTTIKNIPVLGGTIVY